MAQKVKLSDALALKSVSEDLAKAQTEEEIDAEFAEKKADLDAALAEHQKIRDAKLDALVALKSRAIQVTTDTGVKPADVESVDLAKAEVTLKG